MLFQVVDHAILILHAVMKFFIFASENSNFFDERSTHLVFVNVLNNFHVIVVIQKH